MNTQQIFEHFMSRSPWINTEKTTDRILAGDPQKEINTCLVAWMPSWNAVRYAVEKKIDLLVHHEPIYWGWWDHEPETKSICDDKREYIEESGLVILRNHDSWDQWPEIGVPHALAKHLGFNQKHVAVAENNMQFRYDIDPVPFGEFAKSMAQKTALLNEPTIEVVGDPDKPVTKIGIGTGCACRVMNFVRMGCDCCFVCDDGAGYWGQVQYAKDIGVPVICINHGTAEESGMETLAQYINDTFDGISAEHYKQGCRFETVSAST